MISIRILFKFSVLLWTMIMAIMITGFFSAAVSAGQTVPSELVRMPPGSYAILVEKESQTLFLYGTGDKGGPELVFKAPCSTGEAPGPKRRVGDKKTPEGVYFITDEYEDRYLSPIYGKKAFPMDYPNFLDRRSGWNGSAIWIHGTNKELLPTDSNGCVAMENDDIMSLASHVALNFTPVIVVQEIKWADPSVPARDRELITKLIRRWAHAQARESYHAYLEAYDPVYLPDISWWPDWNTMRQELAGSEQKALDIITGRLGIYRTLDQVAALFDYAVEFKGNTLVMGQKKLFLTPVGNPEYRIVGDVFQTYADGYDSERHPLLSAALRIKTPLEDDAFFIELVEKWLKAWSSADMEAYAAFYADNFVSDGMNKDQWVDRKKRLARKYSYIRISAGNFKVSKQGRKCIVRFYQDYESSGFSTQGTKTLVFHKKGESWKIFQESWKEN